MMVSEVTHEMMQDTSWRFSECWSCGKTVELNGHNDRYWFWFYSHTAQTFICPDCDVTWKAV